MQLVIYYLRPKTDVDQTKVIVFLSPSLSLSLGKIILYYDSERAFPRESTLINGENGRGGGREVRSQNKSGVIL